MSCESKGFHPCSRCRRRSGERVLHVQARVAAPAGRAHTGRPLARGTGSVSACVRSAPGTAPTGGRGQFSSWTRTSSPRDCALSARRRASALIVIYLHDHGFFIVLYFERGAQCTGAVYGKLYSIYTALVLSASHVSHCAAHAFRHASRVHPHPKIPSTNNNDRAHRHVASSPRLAY